MLSMPERVIQVDVWEGVCSMRDYTREDVIEALEYLISPNCTDTQFDYCNEIRAAIELLKEQSKRIKRLIEDLQVLSDALKEYEDE